MVGRGPCLILNPVRGGGPVLGQRPIRDSELSERQRPRPNREAQGWAEAHALKGEPREGRRPSVGAEAQA